MDYRKNRQNGTAEYTSPRSYQRKSDKKDFGAKPARNYRDDRKTYADDKRNPYPESERKPYTENSPKNYSDSRRKPYAGTVEKMQKERFEKVPEPTSPAAEEPVQEDLPYLIIGRNAVREALRNGRSIDRILVNKERDGSLSELVKLTKEKNIQYREVDRKKLDELCMPFGHSGKTANHQGIVAYAAGVEYCSIEDILHVAKERNEAPFVIVLDGVEDPHNLGSIIRSAECAGAHGVILGKRRSASVTPAVVKASCGATEYMKIARVVNISGALEELKRNGLWVAGADMSGISMSKQGLNGALALVIGSEGSGLTKLVRETCDFLVSIPLKGKIESLNASVAASILMFEKCRQDEQSERS